MKHPVLILLFALLSCKRALFEPLRTILEWKTLEFHYESEEQKREDLDSGFYSPSVAIPLDVDVHYSNSSGKRIFMSIPRLKRGSPITLGVYTGMQNSEGVPVVEPFPSWSWHRNIDTCRDDQLVSVWGIKVDECGRLWVVDNGETVDVSCPRKVLVFDLDTGELLQRIRIPSDLTIVGSFLVNPKVDVRNGNCRDVDLYIADAAGMSILVYTSKSQRFTRVQDGSMLPDPKYSTVTIGGQSLEGVLDGVFGLGLEPARKNRDRRLFYSALTSSRMNHVRTSVLKQQRQSINPREFTVMEGHRPNTATSFEIDRNGVLYFGYFRDPSSFHCWNTRSREYGTFIDTIQTNSTTLQFAGGVKVINNPSSGNEELWVLTSRFFKAFYGPLDVNDVNFRIMIGDIPDVLQHTSCMSPNQKPMNLT